MPTRDYLSPGIYTQEKDLSFLQSAPAGGPSAVFIGGFTKGQAFIPMKIKDTYDLLDKTGEPNGKFFSQYAAYQYSKHKGNFWVQRLLWWEGYSKSAYAITATSGSTSQVLAILVPTENGNLIQDTTSGVKIGVDGTWSGSTLSFATSGSSEFLYYTISNASSLLSLDDYFGTNPYQPTKHFYLLDTFTNISTFSGSSLTGSTITIEELPDFMNFTGLEFNHATTPWFRNESGTKLFKLHHVGDGDYTNREIKIAVQRLNDSPTLQYAKFDIIIRAYDDTDKKPVILETFYEVDLNPLSESYIGKRIGDQHYIYDSDNNKLTLEGNYPNKSNYVRVQLSDDVKESNIAKLGLPKRVDKIPCAYSSSAASFEYTDPVYETTSYSSTTPYYKHQGYHTHLNSIRALSVPQGVSSSVDLWTNVTHSYDQFTYDYFVPMYGGFDGKDPSTGYVTDPSTIFGFDVTGGVNSTGYAKYVKALNMLKNTQEFDIDVISLAGVNIETPEKKVIFEYALQQVCEERGDCIVVADAAEMNTLNVAQVSGYTAGFDSSFGAVYYPAVKIKCPYTKTFPIIPAATLIPSVIAYTERVSQPHYAPAGINRGTLNVLQAVSKLNRAERDSLYAAKINPIASFASNGTVVWGQKTLQQKASALDRLNVRILINRIAKWINAYGKTVLFDNNTASLRAIFTIGVQAYLNNLITLNGLYAFKFKMDQTNNTPDIIDRNQLIGQVWIKPTKTAQFIIIPINIVRTDAEL